MDPKLPPVARPTCVSLLALHAGALEELDLVARRTTYSSSTRPPLTVTDASRGMFRTCSRTV